MAINPRDLDFIARPPRGAEMPCETVGRLLVVADLLQLIDKAIDNAWTGVKAAGLERAAEEALTDYDFRFRGRRLMRPSHPDTDRENEASLRSMATLFERSENPVLKVAGDVLKGHAELMKFGGFRLEDLIEEEA